MYNMVLIHDICRMLEAIRQSKEVTQASVKALTILEDSTKEFSKMAFNHEETYIKVKDLASHSVLDIKNNRKQIVSFVNSLPHDSVQLVSVLVNSADVMVGVISISSASQLS